jgi:hypothetical protein
MIQINRPAGPLCCACVLAFTIVLGFSGPAGAQVASASGADAVAKSAAPVDFRSARVEVRDEHQNLQDGSTLYRIVPRLDFALNPDLSLRVEAPVVFSDPGLPASDKESGLGDLLFRGSYRVAHGAGYAIVAGSEVIFNSASNDSLGMGKNVIAPLIYASIDVPQCKSVLFPFLQYYVTIGGDDARTDVHYTSLKAPFLTRWSSMVYTILEPQVVVDHARADKVGMTFEGEIGRFVNRDLAFWGRPGLGLFGDNLPQVYNWKLEIGVRFFLK